MSAPTVVVGGGIVGTTIAYELQRSGRNTILVERDVKLQGASAFSFASISAFDEPQRDVYLLKTFGMGAWRTLAKDLGPELGLRFPGELRWAESPEAGRHLTVLAERAASRGYPTRHVSSDEIGRIEPAASAKNVAVASFSPEDGQVDPVLAVDAIRNAFVAMGGAIVAGRAGLLVDGGITVRVGDDSIQADTVVIAAGAETSALLGRMGWDIPMDPSPGLIALTTPLEPFLKGTVYVYPEGKLSVHLRQRDDGRVMIGERAQDEVARRPTIEHARSLLQQASESFPILRSAVIDHFTVEWRPMPRDGMPIVGPLPGLPSLYVATGHSGITIAPAIAGFVAQELVKGTEAERLRALRPSRFSVRQTDLYRSIDEVFEGASEIFIG